MKIIAHRGFWISPDEKNTPKAFMRAFENNFGIETDFREINGGLVVSHDFPTQSSMSSEELIEITKLYPSPTIIAINIKTDGLSHLVKSFVEKLRTVKYFAFDMSATEYRSYFAVEVPVFTRMSEYETSPIFLSSSDGIWFDSFDSIWFDPKLILAYLNLGKQIAFVSPELHGRDHSELWHLIREQSFHLNPSVSICTDYPQDAREFFCG